MTRNGLLTGYLQALLSVHDTVAMKNYDPVLPPMPDDFDDDEDSVKIIRLVKNKEPLVKWHILDYNLSIHLHLQNGLYYASIQNCLLLSLKQLTAAFLYAITYGINYLLMWGVQSLFEPQCSCACVQNLSWGKIGSNLNSQMHGEMLSSLYWELILTIDWVENGWYNS